MSRTLRALLTLLLVPGLGGALVFDARSAPPPTTAASGHIMPGGRPAMRVFDDEDGIPSNGVEALAMDPKGYLWVGTQDGAARYDGRTWTVVNMPDRTRSNMVRSLVADSSGTLLFGTNGGGLARLVQADPARWDLYTSHGEPETSLPNDNVRCILETRSDDGGQTLWAGTDSGVARFEQGRWTVYNTASGLPSNVVNCLEETRSSDGTRTIWAGTDRGLACFRDSWTVCDVSSPDGGLSTSAVASLRKTAVEDGSEGLWVGTETGLVRLHLLEDGLSGVAESVPLLVGQYVRCVLESGDGGLWVGTRRGGLFRLFDPLRSDRSALLERVPGLPNDDIRTLLMTGAPGGPSTLWVATNGGGLVRLDRGRWTAHDTSTGLPVTAVGGFLELPSPGGPRFWLTTASLGVISFDPASGEWKSYGAKENGGILPTNSITCMRETLDGDGFWIGMEGGGLARFRQSGASEKWTVYNTRTTGGELPSDEVWCLAESEREDGTRVLWAGTSNGLARFDQPRGSGPGRWTAYSHASAGEGGGLPYDDVRSLLETRTGDGVWILWVGTDGGGLARMVESDPPGAEQWRVYDTSSAGGGLPNNSILGLLETTSIDGASTLWVGTYGGGIAWCDPSASELHWQFLSDTTTPALPNNSIYQLCKDRLGRVYVPTNKGVARITRRSPTPDDPAIFSIYSYTTEDGLPSNECNQSAISLDKQGRIWVGTIKGAAVLDPAEEFEDRKPKPLYIERTFRDGFSRPISQDEALSYDENNLAFEFALLSYFREGETRYKTQLVGFDRAPSGWGPDFQKSYTNLPSGDYTFFVWGRDAFGNVSGPVRLAFSIRQAPWQTWWAWVLGGATLAAIVYLGMQFRVRVLRRQHDILEAIVAERTAALVESEARTKEQAGRLAEMVEQLKGSEQRALEASRAKSTFLSTMSHELRTPLNAVIGFAQLMERDGGRSAEDQEHLEIILQSGEHLLGLINDVLSIAKIEAGKLTLSEQPFNLLALLHGVQEMVRVKAEAKGLGLVFDLTSDLPASVRGDEGKLRQVLLNLLGNAVKFTDEGGVALRAAWNDSRASFEIEDTGHGMTEAEVEQLFVPFVQTESGQKAKEGTGLGLVISREIIYLMGGEISVRSRSGAGSVFSFEIDLPLSGTAGAIEGRRRVTGLVPGQDSKRILVVDDIRSNRLLLSKLLLSSGFEVREAANGREAVDQWDRWRPQLIFMDIRMAVMDGTEATREIRRREAEEPEASPCRIVALTASAFEHDREAILESGCDDFVPKPFREATIFERLTAHLGVGLRYDGDDFEQDTSDGSVLESGRLAALGTEMVEDLYRACLLNDDLAASEVLDRMASRDEPLASELRKMVKYFRFDEIVGLIERTTL